jgi:hypothetical protein
MHIASTSSSKAASIRMQPYDAGCKGRQGCTQGRHVSNSNSADTLGNRHTMRLASRHQAQDIPCTTTKKTIQKVQCAPQNTHVLCLLAGQSRTGPWQKAATATAAMCTDSITLKNRPSNSNRHYHSSHMAWQSCWNGNSPSQGNHQTAVSCVSSCLRCCMPRTMPSSPSQHPAKLAP